MILLKSVWSSVVQRAARKQRVQRHCLNALLGCVGKHTVSRLSRYDAIKRDWVLKFSSIDTAGIECSSCSLDSSTTITSPGDTSPHSSLRTVWAVSKPRGSVRFSEKVKEYLTARFTPGERTGRKADPAQVAVDMRNAKNESNARLFTREQWLTKSQVQSFFSRLAAMRRVNARCPVH